MEKGYCLTLGVCAQTSRRTSLSMQFKNYLLPLYNPGVKLVNISCKGPGSNYFRYHRPHIVSVAYCFLFIFTTLLKYKKHSYLAGCTKSVHGQFGPSGCNLATPLVQSLAILVFTPLTTHFIYIWLICAIGYSFSTAVEAP